MTKTAAGDTELIVVTRNPVQQSCPACAATQLEEYPVLSEGGWFRVVKCPRCLHSVQRRPWLALGPVQLTSAGLVLSD